jgi:hypothetical protein
MESDTYTLKSMVNSFIDRIGHVLTKSNPQEVTEEFERWLKILTNEK